MKIIFGYYEDEDFGLTEYPDVLISEKESFSSEEELEKEEKKIEEYVKYLITGIMEDFQYIENCEQMLENIKKIENGKQKQIEWDGQAFQYNITKSKVKFTHMIFDESEEYPVWSCKLTEYAKVLKNWNKFLKLKKDLKTKVEVEI